MDIDVLCTNVAGLVGEPFEIETKSRFEQARLTFKLDKEKLPEEEFEDLLILWFDEENQRFVEMNTILDSETYTASVDTTHFSKYMLVNKTEWYTAWAEEINYNQNEAVTKYNTVFAIDCSGSMSSNDPITLNTNINSSYDAQHRRNCNRINAARAVINQMGEDDKIAVVLFNSRAWVVMELSNDKSALILALQQIKNDGNTSLNAAMSKSISLFDEEMLEDEEACNRIILLTDGQSDYSDAYLKNALDKNIRIHTVGLGSGANLSALRRISEYTNGESFDVDTSDELEDLYERIYRTDDFDKTDKDGDGLYDIIETAGMRLPNGNIIYTKSWDEDSDDDGVWDGVEINPEPVYFEKDVQISGVIVQKQGYYFRMISDPNSNDTDGDGLYDYSERTINGETIVPKDDQFFDKNGPVGIWDAKYQYELTHYIPTTLTTYRDIEYEFEDWSTNWGARFLKFRTDEGENVLHSHVKTWQKDWGYNNLYDLAFYAGTFGNMRKEKFKFKYMEEKQVIWIWRGDYPNLGSGCEMGIYENPVLGHWRVSADNFPMTLGLYYNEDGYSNIFSWKPQNPQWWITGFNPDYRNQYAEKMVLVGSIDYTDKAGMYTALKTEICDSIGLKKYMIFDDSRHTVWIVWWE